MLAAKLPGIFGVFRPRPSINSIAPLKQRRAWFACNRVAKHARDEACVASRHQTSRVAHGCSRSNLSGLNSPPRLRITPLEASTLKLSNKNLNRGLNLFHEHGIVIIEDAIDDHVLDHIQERMLRDLPCNLKLGNVQYNHGKGAGNITQTPPLSAEYVHENVWANRFAVHLMEHIIGPRPQLSFATSNVVLPHSIGRQAVHSDYYCEYSPFPVFLEVCIFLTEASVHNGSTELWLGTHNGYSKADHAYANSGWIREDRIKERALSRPPIQPTIKKGSLCIRDLRLWHAGMPNRTSDPRIMLGFIYSPRWFQSHMRLKLPQKAYMRLNSYKQIECIADEQEEDFDYISFREEINLTESVDGGFKR